MLQGFEPVTFRLRPHTTLPTWQLSHTSQNCVSECSASVSSTPPSPFSRLLFISWETKMTSSSSQDLKFSFFIRRRLLRFTIFLSNVYEQKNIASRFMITYMTISFYIQLPSLLLSASFAAEEKEKKTWKSDMTRNQLFFKSSIVPRKIKKSTSRPV